MEPKINEDVRGENAAADKKNVMGWIKGLVVCVVILLVANMAMSGFLIHATMANNTLLSKSGMYGDDPAQEDGVIIAGEYEIMSTENISDAYKSGDTSELDDIGKATLEMATKVIDEVVTEDMSNFEKEKAIYDWMVANTSFDSGALVAIPTTQDYSHTPYGVLLNHTGVCVGYATTFRLFMQMLDMECMVVHSSDLGHSWDLIKLDDEWYHVDVYSGVSEKGYSNFNMNDSMCSYGHSWNTSFFPAANGIKYNMGYQNKQTLDDIYGLPEIIKNMLDEQNDSFFIDLNQYTDEEIMIIQTMLSDVQDRLAYSDAYSDYWMYYYAFVAGEDESKVMAVYFSGYESDPIANSNISDEAAAKIEEAVTEAFGESYDNGNGKYYSEEY